MNLEAEIDRLYSLPLGTFVSERNALAKTVRGQGDREAAHEIKELAKPNLPAWALNQLWHGERASFDRLLEAGADVRAALAGKSTDGPGATARKRDAAKALIELAKNLLLEAGHPNTAGTHRRISHTLEAAAALGAERLDPPLGRLTRDLEPQGFDVLLGLQLAPPATAGRKAKKSPKPSKPKQPTRSRAKAPTKAVVSAAQKRKKAEQAKRIRAAREQLKDRLAALDTAQVAAKSASEKLSQAKGEAKEAASEAKRAAKAARDAEKRSKSAQKDAAAARKAFKAAQDAARTADTAVKAAQRKLKQAGG